MSEGTRRIFLAGSGVGAAAVGLAALTPALTGATGAGSVTAAATTASSGALLSSAESGASALTGSLVAVVRDVSATEVSLMVGVEEIVVHDEELVARLVRATAR
jgi:hypothetical protein